MINLFGEKIKTAEPVVLGKAVLPKREKLKLKDYLNDLTMKHGNLLTENKDNAKDLSIFSVNRALSKHRDCILLCDEMNRRSGISKEFYYSYMYNSLRKTKRFQKYVNPYSSDDLALVKEHYKYSDKKALEALKILKLKPNALDNIRKSLNKGGV